MDGHGSKADLYFLHGVTKEDEMPLPKKKYAIISEFHSQICSLSQPEDEILAQINKSEKYQIRKSERDGGTVRMFTGQELREDPGAVNGLSDMYEEMYREKGTPKAFNRVQFDEYLKQDCIVLSAVYQEGVPLVFHSYVTDKDQARLLHSVSEFRNPDVEANLIGRANKRLHYEDMLYFKRNGLKYYDWGGISSLTEPNGIDVFKMKFGGETVTYTNIICGGSFLGKLAVTALKLKDRISGK